MIATNNNVNPLPWYRDIKSQDRHRWYAYGEVFLLATPRTTLLPFQIRRRKNSRTTGDISVKLYTCCGNYVRDITEGMKGGGLTIESVNNIYENIIYRGNAAMAEMPLGAYYAVLSDGENVWYSEVFTVVPDIEKYIRIDYWAVENQNYESNSGAVIYETGYINTLYIDATICRPDYQNEDEVENRDLYPFSEKKLSKKTFAFSFYAPEYLVDALRLPYLADFVRITSNGEEYKIFDFLATPKWTDNLYGHYASVSVEAQLDTILKKIQPSKSYTPEISITGRVVNYLTGMPIPNVKIRILDGQALIANITTSSLGTFFHRWFPTTTGYPARLTFSADVDGYWPVTYTINTPSYEDAIVYGISEIINMLSKQDTYLEPETLNFGKGGGAQKVVLVSQMPMGAVVSSDNWIVPSVIMGSNDIIVTVGENMSTNPRTGTVTVWVQGVPLVVNVYQAATTEYLYIAPTEMILTWRGIQRDEKSYVYVSLTQLNFKTDGTQN